MSTVCAAASAFAARFLFKDLSPLAPIAYQNARSSTIANAAIGVFSLSGMVFLNVFARSSIKYPVVNAFAILLFGKQ